MKRLIIIGYSPLCQKQNVILGIDELSKYTEVEYWDVSLIIGDFGRLPEIRLNNVLTKKIQSIKEFAASSKEISSNDFVVFYMYVNPQTYVFYKLLAHTKCEMAAVVVGALPILADYKTYDFFSAKIRRLLKMGIMKFIKTKICFFINKTKLYYIRPFDYYLYAGAKVSFTPYNYNSITSMVPINDYDYQISRSVAMKRLLDGRYILFIDQYIPFHPDNEICGGNLIDADNYYEEINKYFDSLEDEYGIPVIISAHPKADKYIDHNYFDGRKIFYNQSSSLSFFADFIVTHYSTAVSFPIIFKKPIIFVYTNDMKDKDAACPLVYKMAYDLNCNCVNISTSNELKVRPVNEQCYSDYLYSYITSPLSENTDNYRIILDLLK